MRGRKKLTNKERKKILADYINNNNYRETARINNVAVNTVKNIVLAQDSKEFAKICTQKKEEETKDILKYMDSIYEKQKNIIDLSLSALEEKLKKPDMFTNVKDIATVYGVIFDKALKYKEIQLKDKNNSNTEEINNGINNIVNLLNNPKPVRTEEDLKDE